MRAFLWKGVDLKNTGAKVERTEVCKPKDEGGLGIKRLKDWNAALLMKHIWKLFTDKQALWSRWIHSYHLRGRSLWEIRATPTSSWTWQNILKLREVIRPLLTHKIGNGYDTFLWLDSWHPSGPLFQRWGHIPMLASALNLCSKVSCIISGSQWCWPNSSTALARIVDSMPAYSPNHLDADSVLWTLTANGRFTTTSAWHYIRVFWAKNSLVKACLAHTSHPQDELYLMACH